MGSDCSSVPSLEPNGNEEEALCVTVDYDDCGRHFLGNLDEGLVQLPGKRRFGLGLAVAVPSRRLRAGERAPGRRQRKVSRLNFVIS